MNDFLKICATTLLSLPLAWADTAKVAYQEGRFNFAARTLTPTDPVNDFYLGKLRLYGYGLLKHNALALEYFTNAAQKGYLPAEQLLARYALITENDPTKALAWFKKAADQGDNTARMYCAAAYLFGYGAPKNPDMARRFYIEAAKTGDALAQFTLANQFLTSKDANSKKLGFIWLNKAATQGNAMAQDTLGTLELEGKLTPADPEKATALFQQAAQQGLTTAMLHLSDLAIARQQYSTAKDWLIKANITPTPATQLALAQFYLIKDTPYYQPTLGFSLALNAAKNGEEPSIDAALLVAKLFEQGIGTPANVEKSQQWQQTASARQKETDKHRSTLKTIVSWLSNHKNDDVSKSPYALKGIWATWNNPTATQEQQYYPIPDTPTMTVSQLFTPRFELIQPESIALSDYFDHIVQYMNTAPPTLETLPQYALNPTIEVFQNHQLSVLQHQTLPDLIYPDALVDESLDPENTELSTLLTLLELTPPNQAIRVNFQNALLELYNRAILGDSSAQFDLGQLYQTGIGVSKNLAQAVTYYELAAAQQETSAAYQLGLLYLSGQITPVDYQKGLNWLMDAAFKGNSYAQFALGSLYQQGLKDANGRVILAPNPEQSTAMYFLTAANDFAPGEYQLATQLVKQNQLTFAPKLKRDRQQFIHYLYEKAAENGIADATLPLAFYQAMSDSPAIQQRAFETAAQQAGTGSPVASLLLGLLYDTGRGTSRDEEMAQKWYEKATFHPVTAFILGTHAASGSEGPRDAQKAKQLLTFAADHGLGVADYNLAILKHDNHEPFIPHLMKAQQEGNATAGLLLADTYLSTPSDANNLALAKDIYTQFAAKGDPSAATKLAYLYEQGLGTNADPATAEKWYQRAANQQYPTAQFLLGKLYQSGRLNTPNYPEAKKWYQAAATKSLQANIALGFLEETLEDDYQQAAKYYETALQIQPDALAQYNLGLIYEYGKSTIVNPEKAFQLYQAAAERGHVKAMTQLAHAYENGMGTAVNHDKAITWYQKAAQHQDHRALYQLGLLHAATPELAAKDFEQAMNLGNEQALMALAHLLQTGNGIPKNEERALALYTTAANNHNAEAAMILAKLHEQRGQTQQAQQWLEKAKQTGHPQAQEKLSWMSSSKQSRVSVLPKAPLNPVKKLDQLSVRGE